jgi:hypothetical protein
VTGQGKAVGADRLNDQEVARLVKRTALAAGVRGDLPEGERGKLFAGHSLRSGLASSAEVDERYVQKQLGHASAEMTRKYQRRRDRFRVNLTKASGCTHRAAPPDPSGSHPSKSSAARAPIIPGRRAVARRVYGVSNSSRNALGQRVGPRNASSRFFPWRPASEVISDAIKNCFSWQATGLPMRAPRLLT